MATEGADVNARDRIASYYDALRRGAPLAPYFATDDELVKFGISETLVGFEAVREGLREQTATTDDWALESHALCVTERDDHAWFSDDVEMSWTDTTAEERRAFDARWSGTLEERAEWVFVGMHVSAAHNL